jgi:glycoprotease/Kae1 family metallohydrolase
VIARALADAGVAAAELGAVAATVGPGLEICLRVGARAARGIAAEHGLPFAAVHHLEAHVLMSRLPPAASVTFPFLALLVSGGHCQLLRCGGLGRCEVVGGTLDDSLGEAYDKVARMLGLPVGGGGGPAVEELALEGDRRNVRLPIPMQQRKDCDFSFAGLKNAFRMANGRARELRGVGEGEELPRLDRADLAASFQWSAVRHLEQRVGRAMGRCEEEGAGIDRLVVVGGVAANAAVRGALERLCGVRGWQFSAPEPRLCTDNGVMAAWAGIEKLRAGVSDDAGADEVFARYPFARPREEGPL